MSTSSKNDRLRTLDRNYVQVYIKDNLQATYVNIIKKKFLVKVINQSPGSDKWKHTQSFKECILGTVVISSISII